MKKGNLFGLILIVLGVVVLTNQSLLDNFFGINLDQGRLFGIYWPTLFVIPLGLLFHAVFFLTPGKKLAGLLVPGGILTFGGIVCQISMLDDTWGYNWPGFLAAIAIALFELYLFGERKSVGLLVAVGILGFLSIAFFSAFTMRQFPDFARYGIAGLLILIGGGLVFKRGGGERKRDIF